MKPHFYIKIKLYVCPEYEFLTTQFYFYFFQIILSFYVSQIESRFQYICVQHLNCIKIISIQDSIHYDIFNFSIFHMGIFTKFRKYQRISLFIFLVYFCYDESGNFRNSRVTKHPTIIMIIYTHCLFKTMKKKLHICIL